MINFKTQLLPLQTEAVKKLLPIKVGALYMEMGTGKTRVTLDLIAQRLQAEKIKHVLWLCPCTVRQNLKEDIVKHTDGALSNIAIFGIESLSASLRLYELLLNYIQAGETMLVVDESALLKNHLAIRTQRITELSKLCKYRIILNGTPISKNEADLFAQWKILDWRILGYRSFSSFAANHLEYDTECPSRVRRVLNTDYLTEKIAPYTYQCSKSDMYKLPRKCYKLYDYVMDEAQMDHYSDVMDRMIDLIDEQQPTTIYRMFSAAQAIISGLYVIGDLHKHIETKPMFNDPYDNPRIQTLLDLIKDCKIKQAIVFCKYTHEIESLYKILPHSEMFYGKLNKKQRQTALDNFKAGNASYLIANKTCAGFGLNLQFCRNVIFYNNDWDYATRAQAEDRVHRIGQDKEVCIYDILAKYTLDVKISKCLTRKENLADCIKSKLKSSNTQLDAKGEFRKWLKGELNDAGENISAQKCI